MLDSLSGLGSRFGSAFRPVPSMSARDAFPAEIAY